ncbi:antibiotic biosynthesis monooxygenase [Galbitalea sp. SE-J8]|uniref:antibiotic biosynthesis monooxygenase n=1 Tax=Galbitalea sp. SE-J8 TaxID=3054952 RepID=UPI00259D1A7C|nr:antibiotic biosynthesis monooxygenase [Galbitalea sp. SE-J8]MDM4761707.1 antibiotic biosynthesis monooxygenase [Galbitalea sp. SE-J8]
MGETSQMRSEPITVSVTRTVAADQAHVIAAWARSGQELIAGFPGYLGSGWIRPDPASDQWHMLFRFADAASLAAWERSPERAWWVASAQGLVGDGAAEKRTGIEGWFDDPAYREFIDRAPASPPRWKQMVSIIIVFFPLSLLANWSLGFVTVGWPLPLRVLLLVLVVAPIMTYFGLPFITRALRPWLLKGRR